LDVIRDEHRVLERVLNLFEGLASDDASLARAVESGKIALILRFLFNFSSAVHHPKEEGILYPALAAKDLSGALDLDGYLNGHAIDYALLQGIETALAGAGNAPGRARLGDAIRVYVAQKRRHIKREDEIVLPRAQQVLGAEDLAAMAAAFAAKNGASAYAKWRAEWDSLVDAGDSGRAD
jgi:branched-chain amino acid transport system ATP-binding protein